MNEALYIGLMSGTSLDGIDAALVSFSPKAQVHHAYTQPFRASLQQQLRLACQAPLLNAEQIGQLDRELGLAFADAVQTLLEQTNLPPSAIRAIGSHGQTIRHCPEGPLGFSWQIGDPATIAEQTGITTVADFRRRDVAAGGQGAPLVPAFHDELYRSLGESTVVLNLGGIANISWLGPEQALLGFDTGPANLLIDHWVSVHQGQAFDAQGRWAASGQVNPTLLARMLEDPFFAAPAPKSTGRERFNADWLQQQLDRQSQPIAPIDVQATLVELTARSITQALTQLPSPAQRLLVCGGGRRNDYLLQRLQALLQLEPELTDQHGMDGDWMEAAAFAWLAQQTLSGAPSNSPAVTGARGKRILGAIYLA